MPSHVQESSSAPYISQNNAYTFENVKGGFDGVYVDGEIYLVYFDWENMNYDDPKKIYVITSKGVVFLKTDSFLNTADASKGMKYTRREAGVCSLSNVDGYRDADIIIPDLSHTPEYFEEIIPAKIRYAGTTAKWNRIVKLRGEKRIPALVICEDRTIETYL